MKKMLAGAIIIVVGLFVLSASNIMAQEPCTADFDCNGNVDATDVTVFLTQFGRNPFNNPCPDCYDSPCPCATGTTCEGTLSPLGRWCDQGDGTVKDMTTGLVWLKKADWGGQKKWADSSTWDDAHTRAAQLWDGSPWEGTAGLSDGSIEGEWRLPTKDELVGITVGDEYIRYNQMYFFTAVLAYTYWSSSTYASGTDFAWDVRMSNGDVNVGPKDYYGIYVWPVRGGHENFPSTTTTIPDLELCDTGDDCGEGYCCCYCYEHSIGGVTDEARCIQETLCSGSLCLPPGFSCLP